MADEGDTVKVNFRGDTPCILKNLKITHTSSDSKVNFKNFLNRLIKSKVDERPKRFSKETINIAKKTSVQINNICLVKVERGKLVVDNCRVSYEFLTKVIHHEMPAVILFPGTETFLTKTVIKGHSNYRTIGLIAQNATFKMQQCEVVNHLLGGVSVYLCDGQHVEIRNCEVNSNGKVGVEAGGVSGSMSIENSRVMVNQGSGVRLTGDLSFKIWNNEIEENVEGVEIISTEANLLKNKIKKNRKNGISIRSTAKVLCNVRLVFNIVIKNRLNGILIEGSLTRREQLGGGAVEHEHRAEPAVRHSGAPEGDAQNQKQPDIRQPEAGDSAAGKQFGAGHR